MRRVRIFVNQQAGRRGSAATNKLEKMLAEGAHPLEVRPVPPDRLWETLAREAGSSPLVAVGGGDGTICSAAEALAGSGAALLPVPMGTLNHFARRMGIGTLEEAVEALSNGDREVVSVGILDDRIFLNTATFGLYADLVRIRNRLQPYLTKWPAALVAFFVTLVRLRQIEIAVHVGGEFHRRSTPLLWVGLGEGTFPRVTASDEELASPELEIVVVRARTRYGSIAQLLRLTASLMRGEHPRNDPGLEIFHARHLLIHSPHRIGITRDGEISRGTSPLFVAVQEGALTIVRPARMEES